MNSVFTPEYPATGTSPIVTTVNYQYANAAHPYSTKVSTQGSDGITEELQWKYVQDYSTTVPAAMQLRNFVSPVLEEKRIRIIGGVSTLMETTAQHTVTDFQTLLFLHHRK